MGSKRVPARDRDKERERDEIQMEKEDPDINHQFGKQNKGAEKNRISETDVSLSRPVNSEKKMMMS